MTRCLLQNTKTNTEERKKEISVVKHYQSLEDNSSWLGAAELNINQHISILFSIWAHCTHCDTARAGRPYTPKLCRAPWGMQGPRLPPKVLITPCIHKSSLKYVSIIS